MGGRNYRAEGYYNISNGKLTVLRGSRTVRTEPPSFKQYYKKAASIRYELINRGIISNYEFVEDFTFEIPFHAAATVQANGQAGEKAWKTIDGTSIEEIVDKNKNLEQFKDYLATFISGITKSDTDKVIKQFQEQFPLENLKSLTLEEYDKTGKKYSLLCN